MNMLGTATFDAALAAANAHITMNGGAIVANVGSLAPFLPEIGSIDVGGKPYEVVGQAGSSRLFPSVFARCVDGQLRRDFRHDFRFIGNPTLWLEFVGRGVSGYLTAFYSDHGVHWKTSHVMERAESADALKLPVPGEVVLSEMGDEKLLLGVRLAFYAAVEAGSWDFLGGKKRARQVHREDPIFSFLAERGLYVWTQMNRASQMFTGHDIARTVAATLPRSVRERAEREVVVSV